MQKPDDAVENRLYKVWRKTTAENLPRGRSPQVRLPKECNTESNT